jgi:zinc transport system substrate-binding protein
MLPKFIFHPLIFSLLILMGVLSTKVLAEEKLRIAASFYPLAELARQVGGNRVEVINMTPAGVEPHDYEPTPRDIIRIRSAKVFLFNGGNTDAWAEKIQEDLKKRGVEVVNMSETLAKSGELLKGQEVVEESEKAGFDPHFWLDPVLMQKQAMVVRDVLIKVDPGNVEYYTKTAADYLNQLAALDQKYREGLAHCQIRDVITSHAAFGYLARRYNLNMIYISGLSPNEEPSPRRIADIARLARQKNIEYIFFEPLTSPKLAQTIAQEVGAKTLVFNPLEGLTDEEVQAGKNYISIMEENLKNLRIALRCQ